MADRETGPVRVLLLAREGEARQRLESAIADAGAELLCSVDPGVGDPGEVLALEPGAVLVALEPAIEDALEAYEALLSAPGVLVMFEEAEVAARRDGWDAARWVRHLAAKLNGHQDVLPPGGESGEAVHPEPGPLPARGFDPGIMDLAAIAGTARELAAEVPRADAFDAADALHEDPALAGLPASSAAASDAGNDGTGEHDGVDVEATPVPGTLGERLSLADDDSPLQVRDDTSAIDLEALEARVGGLSLADDDAPIVPRASDAGAGAPAFEAQLEGLSLADPDSYGHGQLRGAVVVEAGLGGPDAVRQLLAGLDAAFARAVLVRLQLDGGRYDRLVQQMQRASVLPVSLAEAGAEPVAGTVYFLPPEIDVVEDRSKLRFQAAEPGAGAYAALPPGDSALVFLSGANADRVEPAMALARAGALVLAQEPESCYDAGAVDALVAQGAIAAGAGDLARALSDRWP